MNAQPTTKIFIDGDAGTTGLEIRERLAGRTDIELVAIPAEKRKDVDAKRAILAAVDIAILCLPDDAAKETVALCDALGEKAPRLLDASTAHRVAPGWVYGFPELCAGQAEMIAKAKRVANVGCYATASIALIRPLVDAGLIRPEQPLTINAVSGYSGGGRQMIESYEAGKAPAFELYALGLEHKHIPEIMEYAKLTTRPIFAPSVGNFRQGMLVSIPLHLDALPGQPRAADFEAVYRRHYPGDGHVKALPAPASGRIDALGLNGGDEMELYVFANESRRHAVLVARLDNLGKGASGAAVQNLDLMIGGDSIAHRPCVTVQNDTEIAPERTLELLKELLELGYNDEAFWRLHHFRRRGNKETIASFRAYCEKTSAFQPGGSNERVHRRLAFVLQNYRESGTELDLVALSDLAFEKIPPL